MTDPHDIPGRKQPARAEPLQPDLPGQGLDTQERTPQDEGGSQSKAADQEKARTDAALENVSKGYGGPS